MRVAIKNVEALSVMLTRPPDRVLLRAPPTSLHLATGLVDHCPHVEGAPPDRPIDAVRFCPICDGYEATDRRVGVLGDLASGAKKALFLRTYTPHVSLFAVAEASGSGDTGRALADAKVAAFPAPKQK